MKTSESIETAADRFDPRDRPVAIGCGSTYGHLRGLMGPAGVSFMLYDDPELVREIMRTRISDFERYTIPLIERIRPDILAAGEDCCYNHGMLLSPKHFREFCAPFYHRVCEVARDCGVDMVAIDTDGNAMELVPIVEGCGVNAIFPFEVKAGNDLFALREHHPRFVLMGWLDKEVVNAGNSHLIHDEIMSKAPPLLEKGGYFPNGDHGIQPLVTFDNLCRFMTLLHEVTGNPEGEFPRIWGD
jgi:uroporphyrinogen decarboxylase